MLDSDGRGSTLAVCLPVAVLPAGCSSSQPPSTPADGGSSPGSAPATTVSPTSETELTSVTPTVNYTLSEGESYTYDYTFVGDSDNLTQTLTIESVGGDQVAANATTYNQRRY